MGGWETCFSPRDFVNCKKPMIRFLLNNKLVQTDEPPGTLLVDFIRHSGGEGKSLREVVLEAGAVRFKPILLTALAAMIGAATILLDPIFQGLAISLLFGLASSTLLTVLVIPAIYVALRAPRSAVPTTGQSR